jgi:FkbM family methyltransferase
MKMERSVFFVAAICAMVLCLPAPLLAKAHHRLPKKKKPVPQMEAVEENSRMQGTGESPKVYHRFVLPPECLKLAAQYLPDNPVIVDAGAYYGEETCTMAKLWKNGHVHAFEPVTQLFGILAKNTKDTPNISIYNTALGKECTYIEMFLSSEKEAEDKITMSSSLLPPKDHLLYSSATFFDKSEMVEVTTLDQWAEDYGIERVDMLWLDMQGYELPALKAAPKVLSTVSVILTELEFVEAYEGQPLYKEVRKWLEGQGFVLIAGNFSFPKERTQWFGDGLFVRKELLSP